MRKETYILLNIDSMAEIKILENRTQTRRIMYMDTRANTSRDDSSSIIGDTVENGLSPEEVKPLMDTFESYADVLEPEKNQQVSCTTDISDAK